MELIKIDNGRGALAQEVINKIADFERKAKEIKDAEDELKERIREEMEAKGIIKIETPDVVINYIAPTDRETFDSKKFRSGNPDLYDEYVRMSPVKASIRIKVVS